MTVCEKTFYEIQKTGHELQKLEKYIVGSKNKYDALLVKSYDNVWGHDINVTHKTIIMKITCIHFTRQIVI